MGEIKSALELALEKAERLGKLSPAEIKREEEKKLTFIGKALADNYLGGTGLKQLEAELKKYSAQEKVWLDRSLLTTLVGAIEIKDYTNGERILNAISLLANSQRIKEFVTEIQALLKEYKRAEHLKKKEIEEQGRATLHQLGISGSAIEAINPKANPEWQQGLDQLAHPYEQSLGTYQQEFLSHDRS